MVKNLKDLMTRFKDEAACREFLVQQRWNGEPICPYCGHRKSYRIEAGKRFKCANQTCYKKYSVTVGTIFEASNIPLTTWFAAMYLITAHKKGISSVQLGKDLGVTQKTAWFVLHRIRESLRENSPALLEKEVQADEVFIGGLEEYKHKEKRATQQNLGNVKMPVIGVIETGGQVRTKAIPYPTKKIATDFILETVNRNATLVTDNATYYHKVGKKFNHQIINHSEGQFKVGIYHTNSIENYWSVLQRTLYGTYHSVSAKHLQRYCDESAYRFNSRKLHDGFRWVLSLQQIEGRLTYKNLITNAKDPRQEGGQEIETIETGE